MSAVSWNLHLHLNDGRLEDFRALVREMVSATEGEEGTLSYEWFCDRSAVTG
jgi:quinol monooxygenase YgiN